jgi:hypothetical protein
MKNSIITLSALSLLTLTSCISTPSQVGTALISDTKEPVLVTANQRGSKEGKACGQNILGLIAKGDMSVETARKNGGISKITSVDKTVKNMIVVSDVCTIVRGN